MKSLIQELQTQREEKEKAESGKSDGHGKQRGSSKDDKRRSKTEESQEVRKERQ